MAGLFAKTKAAAVTKAPTSKKKETTWLVGNTDDTKKISAAVKELISLNQQSKSIDAKMTLFKGVVKGYAETNYVKDYVTAGVSPETPMAIQNVDGEKVTYVVQDRSSQYKVSDTQKEALAELLGADRVDDLLYEETQFGFNREVMALPGVTEIVEKALESAMKKLADNNILTEEQLGELLEVKSKTAFKPGTLDRLVLLCGRDVVRVQQFLEIMGSSATRYVKA